MFQPEIEQLPLDKLRRLQSERLTALVRYVYEKVPFYKARLDEEGIQPSAISSIDDISRLPFAKKTDLRDQYPFGLFAVPQEDIIRIHASSGTTGKPTVVGYTKGDLDIFSEVVARSLVAAGCKPGMMLHNAYGYGLFTGGLGMHYGAELLNMTVIPVSGGMTERQLMILQDFAPDAICCTPSYAQTLAGELRKRGIDKDALNVKYAILGAEPWTEAIRTDVEAGLGVNATNIYGLSEIIGPGVSNEDFEERGTGSYIWEDHFYPEVVDRETGEPLPYGEPGVLVFTTLSKRGMPLLRYWTGDITTIYYEHSEKRTHIKMGPIMGRADDMLIIRGVNFFPTQIEDLLQHEAALSPHYQVVLQRNTNLDEVALHVEVSEQVQQKAGVAEINEETLQQHKKLATLRDSFAHKIKDTIGLTIKVHLTSTGSIPRSQGGKLSRVKDLRSF